MKNCFIKYQDAEGKIIDLFVEQEQFIQTIVWCHKNGLRIIDLKVVED